MSSANAARKLIYFGAFLLICALLILMGTFYPVLREEVKYVVETSRIEGPQEITPVNTDFAIVIPKIGANAPVIPNVDPLNSYEYQYKLTKGVAHAEGTRLPNQKGNMFLFAHSAGNFYDAGKYNAVFYLLTKLEKDDEVRIYYKGESSEYRVVNKKIVEADAVQYLNTSRGDTLTLMTCWPPGTTLKRLIVTAEKATTKK